MVYLRKLFWGLVSSGILLCFTGFSNVPQKFVSSLQTLKQIQEQNKKDRNAAKSNGEKSALESALELNPPANVNQQPQVQYEEKKEIINDEQYVNISGKYYKYREDHIYMVDGQRVYFVDNRKVAATEKPGAVAGAVSSAYEEMRKKLSKEESISDVLSPEKALKKLQDLQGMATERDKYLEDLKADGTN